MTSTPLVVDTDDTLVNLFAELIGLSGLVPTVTGRIGPRELFENVMRAAPLLATTHVRPNDGLATVETSTFDIAWSVFTDGTTSTAIFVLTRFDDDFAGHLLRQLMQPLQEMAAATGLSSGGAGQGKADADVASAMRHSWSVSMDALLSGAPIASGPQTHQSATLDNAGPPPTSPQLTPDPPPLHVSLGSLAGSITPKHHPIGRAAFPTAQHASPEATPAPDAHAVTEFENGHAPRPVHHFDCVDALRAGQNSVLPPAELGSTIDVLLTWSAHNTVEIDASAILVDADLRVLSDEHFVFFNNLVSPDGSVSLAGDPVVDTGGLSTATITVALDSVDSRASSIVFALSIYDPDTRGQSFAMVQTLNVRVAPHGQTTAHTSFTADRLDGSETAMIMCEIYRRSGAWKIRAVGQGYADGLAGIARDYGVVVS